MVGYSSREISRMSIRQRTAQKVSSSPTPLYRMAAAIGLILLTAGILSSSADALLNHSSHYISEVPSEHKGCDTGSAAAHLVREVATHKLPPCNACFFHHLVSHSLIPRKDQHLPIKLTSRFHLTYRSHTSESFCPKEENRGPPSVGSLAS